MFTVQRRDAVRARVLELAVADARVTAGAAVGSLAVGGGDRFSDLDLSFAVVDGVAILDVLDEWSRVLENELDGVHLVDLTARPAVYRVFLLPSGLQLDLSMAPASEFRPRGPRFRLLFGTVAAGADTDPAGPGALFIPTPATADDIFGWGVIYALHSRACIERGRLFQAEHYVGAVRDHGLSLACHRLGLTVAQARGFDDLPAEVKSDFRDTHITGLEPIALRRALVASGNALLLQADAAVVSNVRQVAERLGEFD